MKDLARVCVSAQTAEETVNAVHDVVEKYKKFIKWAIGSMCAAVELVDPSWAAQQVGSSKKEEEEMIPRLLGNSVSRPRKTFLRYSSSGGFCKRVGKLCGWSIDCTP